jgi:hypothetical protein
MSLHLGVKFAPRRELAPPAGEKRSPLSSPIGAHTLLFRRMEGKYRFYLHPWGPTSRLGDKVHPWEKTSHLRVELNTYLPMFPPGSLPPAIAIPICNEYPRTVNGF